MIPGRAIQRWANAGTCLLFAGLALAGLRHPRLAFAAALLGAIALVTALVISLRSHQCR